LSQTAFAALAGTSKRAQIRYEAGERSPDADYLARLARHGVKIYWVITGKRR
jgi:transcriptional regulator with XRE-family HTH domain